MASNASLIILVASAKSADAPRERIVEQAQLCMAAAHSQSSFANFHYPFKLFFLLP